MITALTLSVLTILGTFGAEPSYRTPGDFSSRKELVSLSRGEFVARLKGSDTIPEAGSDFSEELKAQNRSFIATVFRTKATYQTGSGTWVHPDAGICLDTDELVSLLDEVPSDQEPLALACVVAFYKAQALMTYTSDYQVTSSDTLAVVVLQAMMEAGQYVADRLFARNPGELIPTNLTYPDHVLIDKQEITRRIRRDGALLESIILKLTKTKAGRLARVKFDDLNEAFGLGIKIGFQKFALQIRMAAGDFKNWPEETRLAVGMHKDEKWKPFTRRRALELAGFLAEDDTSETLDPKLIGNLLLLADASKSSFSSVRGEKLDEENGTTTYKCSVTLPSFGKVEISKESEGVSEATAVLSSDSERPLNTYRALLRDLPTRLSGWTSDEERVSRSSTSGREIRSKTWVSKHCTIRLSWLAQLPPRKSTSLVLRVTAVEGNGSQFLLIPMNAILRCPS